MPAYAACLPREAVSVSAESASQPAYVSIALGNQGVQCAALQSACARQQFVYEAETERTCFSGGSENTSLNRQMSLGPDQNILQQNVGSHLTVRSRAHHDTLHVLSYLLKHRNEKVLAAQLVQSSTGTALPWAGSPGSLT